MSKNSVKPKDGKVAGQKRGHNLVPGSAAPHARFAKTKPLALLPPTGTVRAPALKVAVRPAGHKPAPKSAANAATTIAARTTANAARKASRKSPRG